MPAAPTYTTLPVPRKFEQATRSFDGYKIAALADASPAGRRVTEAEAGELISAANTAVLNSPAPSTTVGSFERKLKDLSQFAADPQNDASWMQRYRDAEGGPSMADAAAAVLNDALKKPNRFGEPLDSIVTNYQQEWLPALAGAPDLPVRGGVAFGIKDGEAAIDVPVDIAKLRAWDLPTMIPGLEEAIREGMTRDARTVPYANVNIHVVPVRSAD